MSDLTEPELMVRFLDGLKQASGAAHGMAMSRRDPRWLGVRDWLEAVRENGGKLAVRSALSQTETLAALDKRAMKRA